MSRLIVHSCSAVLLVLTWSLPAKSATYDFDWGVGAGVGLTVTNPFRTANNLPFFGGNTTNLAGVDFHYGVTTSGTLYGLGFDGINLTGAVPPAGPFALTANAPGVTLNLAMPFTADNTVRTQNAGLIGTDAATANGVANQMFYISTAGQHPSATMTFNNLGSNRKVFVQLIGGDAGWNGDLAVTANGSGIGTWTTPADNNTNRASYYGFNAVTNAAGQLQVGLTGSAGNFAGVGGIAILGQTSPTVAPTEAFDANITNTSSLRTATNNAPFALSQNLAGVNLNYGTNAVGTVNGVGFDNVNISGIDFTASPITLTANAAGVTLDLQVTRGNDSPGGRFQPQALTGPDAATLNQVFNDIRYTDHSTNNSDHVTSLFLHGLGADRDVYVELLGSTNGWDGAPEIFANGDLVGIWDSNPGTEAAMFGFYARTDLMGGLMIDLAPTATGSPFAGLSGVVVIGQVQAVPEPTTLASWSLLGIVGLALVVWQRRFRKANSIT